MSSLNLICAIISCFCGYLVLSTCAEKASFLNLQYPAITYFNQKYISVLKMNSRRFSRRDPVHYMSIMIETLFYADNNITLMFSIQEHASNVYRPTFLDLRYKWCDLIERDPFFGRALRDAFSSMAPEARPTKSYKCPHPPGVYQLNNMTLPRAKMPTIFSYEKGRITCNATYKNKEVLGSGYIDFEVTESRRRKT